MSISTAAKSERSQEGLAGKLGQEDIFLLCKVKDCAAGTGAIQREFLLRYPLGLLAVPQESTTGQLGQIARLQGVGGRFEFEQRKAAEQGQNLAGMQRFVFRR
jgi:hypothetical protein